MCQRNTQLRNDGENMSKKEQQEKKLKQLEPVDIDSQEEIEEEVIDEALQQLLANFDADDFVLGDGHYRIVKNYRDGFDYEKLIKRYNDILSKYDYIVGDWGYDQLRLKGFFKDDFKSSPIDARISSLEDYLYEYCNFGCSYFVIEQMGEFKRKGRTTSSNKKPKNKQQAHTEERRYEPNKQKRKPKYKGKTSNQKSPNQAQLKKEGQTKEQSSKNRHFTIRKKES